MKITASVSVPGSSANLGAGFDCIGVAVDRRLEAEVVVTSRQSSDDVRPRIQITRRGTLAAFDVPPETDLVYTGFAAAVARANRPIAGELHFTLDSTIPVARGLGSSAAAIVAGAVLANEALQLGFDALTLVEICAQIEGHPDNVAPSILGGAVLGVASSHEHGDKGENVAPRYTIAPLAVHPSLAFVFAIPSFPTETKRARSVLPATLPFGTAVLAASRAAALVQGLASGHADLLATALDDVLHVPYRRSLIQGYEAVTGAAREAGAIGSTLSGSGSTLVTIASQEAAQGVQAAMGQAWAKMGVEVETFVSANHPVPGAVRD